MTLKIFEDNMKEDKETILRLVHGEDGSVDLVVTNKVGQPCARGYILSITKQGKLYTHMNLADDLGIILAEHDTIALTRDKP